MKLKTILSTIVCVGMLVASGASFAKSTPVKADFHGYQVHGFVAKTANRAFDNQAIVAQAQNQTPYPIYLTAEVYNYGNHIATVTQEVDPGNTGFIQGDTSTETFNDTVANGGFSYTLNNAMPGTLFTVSYNNGRYIVNYTP